MKKSKPLKDLTKGLPRTPLFLIRIRGFTDAKKGLISPAMGQNHISSPYIQMIEIRRERIQAEMDLEMDQTLPLLRIRKFLIEHTLSESNEFAIEKQKVIEERIREQEKLYEHIQRLLDKRVEEILHAYRSGVIQFAKTRQERKDLK